MGATNECIILVFLTKCSVLQLQHVCFLCKVLIYSSVIRQVIFLGPFPSLTSDDSGVRPMVGLCRELAAFLGQTCSYQERRCLSHVGLWQLSFLVFWLNLFQSQKPDNPELRSGGRVTVLHTSLCFSQDGFLLIIPWRLFLLADTLN